MAWADAGASWHASNVMSWSHVEAYFFDLFIFLSDSLLAPVGVNAYHDSLRGDQATVCLFETWMFFITLCSCLFSVSGPLSRGGHSLA